MNRDIALAVSQIEEVSEEMRRDQYLTLGVDAVKKWADRLKAALALHREGSDALERELRLSADFDGNADTLIYMP